jgi:hypothetical protein
MYAKERDHTYWAFLTASAEYSDKNDTACRVVLFQFLISIIFVERHEANSKKNGAVTISQAVMAEVNKKLHSSHVNVPLTS